MRKDNPANNSVREIKAILKTFNFLKIQIKYGTITDELKIKLEFIEEYLSALDEESQEILRAAYIEGISMALIAKRHFCHRTTIFRKCNALIEEMDKIFREKFYKSQV